MQMFIFSEMAPDNKSMFEQHMYGKELTWLFLHILWTAQPPPPGAPTGVDDRPDELSTTKLDGPYLRLHLRHATHSPQQQTRQQQRRSTQRSHCGLNELLFNLSLVQLMGRDPNLWWHFCTGSFHSVQAPPITFFPVPSNQTTLDFRSFPMTSAWWETKEQQVFRCFTAPIWNQITSYGMSRCLSI